MSKKTQQLITRIIAWVLAVLMIISAAAIIISVVASAEEVAPELTEVIEDVNIGGETVSADDVTPQSPLFSEFLPHIDVCQTPIRVGVFYIYGSNNCLAFSHNIFSENGLMFYSEGDEGYSFFHSSDKPVTIMRDFSAAKNSSNKYYFTTDGNTHIIYHALTVEPVESEKLDETIESFKSLLPEGTAVFPFYMSGKPHIAVGTYSDKDASAADCESLKELLGREFMARVPNNTCISIVETESGKILFKIDTVDCRLFVRPLRAEGQVEDAYIKSSVGNIFDGTFEYKATIDGLYLVNILDLDDYVKSVLPYEISASWPVETLKAFSVIVRSYTLSNLSNNHRNEDFDMCDETHCQAYRGRLRSTATTDAAVDSTLSTVLAYDSKICKTFYHAVSGGMTESCENVWYGSYDYIKPVALPFEQYQNHTYGEWSNTVTKSELYSYLESNSTVAKKITGSITGVRISEYTPAGYAYKLEITDSNGNVAVFEKCDNIRTILSKYCKSARMSIGKVMEVAINEAPSQLDAISFFQTDPYGNPIRFNAMANGNEPTYKTVLTASGEVQLVPTTETITISGTGWGHGVGLSQYAARDMANIGFIWTDIATYFFPGAYLANLSDLSTPLKYVDGVLQIPEEDLEASEEKDNHDEQEDLSSENDSPEENAKPPNEDAAEETKSNDEITKTDENPEEATEQ
ncbi:MAG: SpoIID/LytB domain-containing protein [Clostridia bacterium]|nr:SpoIID/LytB domain-containing protein [Clostridia bacterium]